MAVSLGQFRVWKLGTSKDNEARIYTILLREIHPDAHLAGRIRSCYHPVEMEGR